MCENKEELQFTADAESASKALSVALDKLYKITTGTEIPQNSDDVVEKRVIFFPSGIELIMFNVTVSGVEIGFTVAGKDGVKGTTDAMLAAETGEESLVA